MAPTPHSGPAVNGCSAQPTLVSSQRSPTPPRPPPWPRPPVAPPPAGRPTPSTCLAAEKMTLWTGGVPCALRVALAVGGPEKGSVRTPAPLSAPLLGQPRPPHTEHRDVHVDVGHGALLQLAEELLRERGDVSPALPARGPRDRLPWRLPHLREFRGAYEPKLLCPPAPEHDRSAGTPDA